VKGRAQAIPPIVIVAWTQTVATAAWLAFFVVFGHAFTWSRAAWPAVMASCVLVTGMATLIARHSGQPKEQVLRDIDRDRFMTPEEAVEYGLVDEVMTLRAKAVV